MGLTIDNLKKGPDLVIRTRYCTPNLFLEAYLFKKSFLKLKTKPHKNRKRPAVKIYHYASHHINIQASFATRISWGILTQNLERPYTLEDLLKERNISKPAVEMLMKKESEKSDRSTLWQVMNKAKIGRTYYSAVK